MTDAANTPRLIVDKAARPEPASPDRPDEEAIARIPHHGDVQPGEAARSSRKWPVGRIALQLVLAVAILAGAKIGMDRLVATKPEGFTRKPSERVYTVQMAQVQPADHQPTFTVYGNSVAGDTVDLRVLVAGEVVAVHPRLDSGQTVKAGEVLVEVDRFDHEGALTEAEANLQEAEARLAEINAKIAFEEQALERTREQFTLAERDLKRSRDLLESGSGTQKNVDDRQMTMFERAQLVEQRQSNLEIEKTRADQQRAAIRRLQWKTAEARRDLENTRLLSPFDAVVLSASAGLGRNLSANDVVVSLYRSDSVDVRFVVTDTQYGRLISDPRGVIGRQVEVTWNIGAEPAVFSGTIDRVGAELKSERGGVELFASVDLGSSATNLRPGAFVEVAVPDKIYRSTVRLPETAVYKGNQVYVVEEGRLVVRPVTVAAYTGGDVIISSGLEAGEQVLTTQIADARDGLKVIAEGEALPAGTEQGKPAASKPGKAKSGEGEAAARPPERT